MSNLLIVKHLLMDEFELKLVLRSEVIGRFTVKRGFSPRVFSVLSNVSSKVGVVSISDNYVCINFGLKIGIEKTVSSFSKGDVCYSPYLQGLVFFTSASSECSFLKATLIGRMLTPVDGLKSLKEGDVVSIIRV